MVIAGLAHLMAGVLIFFIVWEFSANSRVSALAAVGCAAVYIRTQHVELRLRERLLPHTVHEPAELQDLSVR